MRVRPVSWFSFGVAAFGVAALVAASALAPVAASAPPANFCTSVGLTSQTVKKILGPRATALVYPNPGQDLGICIVGTKGYSGGTVEVYPTSVEPQVIAGYEAKAKVKRPLPSLGKGAVLIQAPISSGYTLGGTDVYYTVGSYFVTITGAPAYPKHPATTTAQLLELAHVIRAALAKTP